MRTTFNPSPIGPPSIGLIRAAVYNWALARHHGGRFVLRIEDTDLARGRQEYYEPLLEVLRWLGLDWDEGPDVGGPNGPYLQTQRRPLHLDVARQLQAAGELYESFSTPEEVEQRNRAAGRHPRMGYDNADRDLSEARKAALRAEGRVPVLRLRMPSREVVYDDLVRGPMVLRLDATPDPVMVRANGDPTFTLANPVDDALMGITHILRGEDLLASVPRHLGAYLALERIGVARFTPRFGHISSVLDEQGRPLSRAVPDAAVLGYRDRGFLPEAMVNYLASIGWTHPSAGEIFSAAELVEAFDPRRIKPRPVKLDTKKAASMNTAHLRALDTERFTSALRSFATDTGVLPSRLDARQRRLLRRAAPLVRDRARNLDEAAGLVAFLFQRDDSISLQDEEIASRVDRTALRAAAEILADVPEWTEETLQVQLKDGFGEDVAFARAALTALRLSITGRRVTLPLYESLVLLGRESSLRRVGRALGSPGEPAPGSGDRGPVGEPLPPGGCGTAPPRQCELV
ncbi:glutamyl-tRNA synthetase [Lentzea fradiae]|uniref:Glutamate--tRNA ligase n=1 Tax=Lentzea fradiae TaxID=200378 RepID=A0A1G7VIG0_9PSEU|nr:glutamate--tRNA ligase [Lentzea fradiae]SDG59341.1 glutamyl-tRNA synthetase [Lentzea fradiae]